MLRSEAMHCRPRREARREIFPGDRANAVRDKLLDDAAHVALFSDRDFPARAAKARGIISATIPTLLARP